jgi:2-haloacid dehalogenase
MTQSQTSTSVKKPKLLLFDVNETLIDFSSLRSRMNELFKHDAAFEQWFLLMLQFSLVDNVTNQYHNFSEIAKAALQMNQERLGRKLAEEDTKELLQMVRSLPPHPDVEEGLKMLKKADYRLVAFTNSTEEVLKQQMELAGLTDLFDGLRSVDELKRYKPAIDTYREMAKKFGVQPEEAMMIAAHGWDMTGALHAGLQAAFVARKGHALYPLAPKPQLTGDTLVAIAEQLVKL